MQLLEQNCSIFVFDFKFPVREIRVQCFMAVESKVADSFEFYITWSYGPSVYGCSSRYSETCLERQLP